jgi:hypothetical protein
MRISHNDTFKTKTAKTIVLLMVPALFGILFFQSCKKDNSRNPPTVELLTAANTTAEGAVIEIGKPLIFKLKAEGFDANITNFTIKILSEGQYRTVLDSGLNARSFEVTKTFYQGLEDTAKWVFSVMDKNRLEAFTQLTVYKDPNSTFGGIFHYPSITVGMDENTENGHFFAPSVGKAWMQDTAQLNQPLVDLLVYFKLSEDNGVLRPSPTFSSPGETENGAFEFYPYLADWETLNYTKYDIRADNGVTNEAFDNAHNDSLLIVSYDDVWGKRKYKWALTGTIFPFMTAGGKKGIVRVIYADTVATGVIEFEMKIQQ